MLASWIQQCAFSPPQILVAVNNERHFRDWLKPGTPFTVNILAEGQTPIVKHFARGFPPGESAFDGLDIQRSSSGAIRLLAAHAVLDCQVTTTLDVGDHTLVIGQVVDGDLLHDARPIVHIRKNGLSY